MKLETDLARIALQEERLRFERFDAAVAWELGQRLKSKAEAHRVAISIEVSLGSHTLFFYAMPGTNPDNSDWLRRKRNVTLRFWRSSYAVGLSLQLKNATLHSQQDLPERDYATHGGCFPVWLGGACVGSVAVSGLPQRQDHALVVEVLSEYLGQPLAELALEDA